MQKAAPKGGFYALTTGGGGTRTLDTTDMSRLLCQLSYAAGARTLYWKGRARVNRFCRLSRQRAEALAGLLTRLALGRFVPRGYDRDAVQGEVGGEAVAAQRRQDAAP